MIILNRFASGENAMRTIHLRFVVLLLFVLTAIPLFAQDETGYQLTAFPIGQTVTDTFEGDVTARLYGFYASAGDAVTISMTQEQGSDLDPLLIVLDANGAMLAVDDDSGSVSLAAQVRNLEIPEDGAYLVLASSLTLLEGATLSDSETPAFTMQISGATIPGTVDDPEQISVVTDLLTAAISGAIDEEQPVQTYLLQASAGDLAALAISSDEFFTQLMVFDPEGARIGADPSALRLELEQDGTYLVLVTDAFFYQIGEDDSFFTGGAFDLRGE
jgi:hypothetical protein